MSQNAHTLHLFFEDPIKLKLSQLVYQYLATGNTEQAQRWADKLGGADLAALWEEEWFNHEVSAASSHLLLRFDTGTSGDLPLQALETLFSHGLKAAVLQVFYDQVGETERMHFDEGEWVSRQAFFEKHPERRSIVEPADPDRQAGPTDEEGPEDEYDCSKDPGKPVSVAKLRKQQAERKQKGQEAAEAFIEMAQAMGKSGVSPVKGLIAVLLLRAGFKGLLQAIAFTVVTVLLFKGLWLWLGLGLVLAIALPLYYMLSEYKDIHGDGDDDSANGGDGDGDGESPQGEQPAGDDAAGTPKAMH